VCGVINETKPTNYYGFNKRYQGKWCSEYECLNMCSDVCDITTGECPTSVQTTDSVRQNERKFTSGATHQTVSFLVMLIGLVVTIALH